MPLITSQIEAVCMAYRSAVSGGGSQAGPNHTAKDGAMVAFAAIVKVGCFEGGGRVGGRVCVFFARRNSLYLGDRYTTNAGIYALELSWLYIYIYHICIYRERYLPMSDEKNSFRRF